MKANELMIRDWVRLQYNHFITEELVTKDFQVTEIHPVAKTNYIWGKDGNMGVVEHIQPIPLTKEILEKNGFDCSDKEIARFDFMDGDYNGHFSLRAMYDKNTGIQHGWAFYAFNVLVVLDYVHELQHAMRLCGIKQEIKL